MSDSTPQSEIPDFATLAADPEIAPLLRFDPVVRKVKRPDGWTPELQRELIARIASTGTVQSAVWQMGKHATGAEALYKTPSADSFRTSWDAAIIIGRRRNGLDSRPPFTGEVPGINRRSKLMASSAIAMPQPGQVMNEHGEWEDEASFMARGEEAQTSICRKLLGCRRLYLQEISGNAGKRAAFEILTELPIDWEKAKRLEPQPDEPWHRANQRQPDMILTAENGWSFGEAGYGEDKKKALREAVDKYRAKKGMLAVNWDDDDEGETPSSSSSPSESPVLSNVEGGDPASSPSPLSRAEPRGIPEDKAGPRVRRV